MSVYKRHLFFGSNELVPRSTYYRHRRLAEAAQIDSSVDNYEHTSTENFTINNMYHAVTDNETSTEDDSLNNIDHTVSDDRGSMEDVTLNNTDHTASDLRGSTEDVTFYDIDHTDSDNETSIEDVSFNDIDHADSDNETSMEDVSFNDTDHADSDNETSMEDVSFNDIDHADSDNETSIEDVSFNDIDHTDSDNETSTEDVSFKDIDHTVCDNETSIEDISSNNIDHMGSDNRAIIENDSTFRNVSLSDVSSRSETENQHQLDNIAEDEEANGDKPECDPHLTQPLCDFYSCTRGEVLLMAMTIALRHSLTWEAITDMLKMVNTIFNDNVVSTSKYFLQKYFPSNIRSGQYHIYCPQCQKYLGVRNNIEENINCHCGHALNKVNTQSYFLQFDVRDQLQHFFNDPKFVRNLNYRSTRVKKNNEALEDVFDGAMYKKMGDLFNDKPNMSYTFNTDGCQSADSSKTTIWPIFMMLHDLPPKDRKKYMIIAGLWVDKYEPNMNIFLEAFVNQSNDLSSIGVTWTLGTRQITTRLIPLVCSVDSKARCKIMNMKQYNGSFGCTFCLHPTESINGKRKYTISRKVPSLRTDASVKTLMLEASALRVLKKDILGVWGPSSLMNLTYFDIVYGMVVDPLHAVLLGASRQWTGIILKAVNKEYYVGAPHHLSKINRRLLSFFPPTVITRTPRRLEDRKLFKGSEWQDWMMFYSLICLKDVLPKKYLENWALFVGAMNLLLQESITYESLKKAEVFLIKFVAGFQDFYGAGAMNYNIHLLLHICRSVRDWGPLWTHSTYAFENQNRLLLKLKHSPARLIPQMAHRFLSFQKIQSFPEKTPISNAVTTFCSSLFDKNLKFFARSGDCVLLGTGKNHTLSRQELQSLNHDVDTCFSYNKIICKGVRYVTFSYHESRCKKSNDSIVLLRSGQIGKILKIYKISYQNHERIILYINLFHIEQNFLRTPDVTIEHIKKCTTVNNILPFETHDLQRPCLYVKIKECEYVILIPYGCYGD